MNWETMLEHYKEDIKDEELLDEAIHTIERSFEHMNKDELFNSSRVLAIAYLALKHQKLIGTQ